MRQKLFIFFAASVALLASASQTAAAEPPRECRSDQGGYCVAVAAIAQAQTGVPGLEFLQISPGVQPGELIAVIYRFGIGLVGLAALAMFIWGGIEYMFAGDKQPAEAKKRMKNALIGLLLALGSWLILYTINPQLVRTLDLGLTPLRLQQTTPSGLTPQQAHRCLSDPACVERTKRRIITIGGVPHTATDKTCVATSDCTRQGAGDYCDPGSGICFAPQSSNQKPFTDPLYNDLEKRKSDQGFLPINKSCRVYTECGGDDTSKYACIASGNTNQKRCWVKGTLPEAPILPSQPGGAVE